VRDARGVVGVEYLVLLTAVSISCAAATASLSGPLLAWLRVQQAVLCAPIRF
jgi:Flp pilus assembly pilin Flp